MSQKKKIEKHANIIFTGLLWYFGFICMFELEKQSIHKKKSSAMPELYRCYQSRV